MANCTKCGAALTDGSAFCGSCGQPVGAAAAGIGSTPAVPGVAATDSASSETGLSIELAAALSYALGLITGILFLVLEPYKNNKFVRFHAIQSILFSGACIIFAIVWSIAVSILVSIAGYWVLTIDIPLRLLIGLGIFVVWLYVMFQAYSKREFRLPFIGDIAAKQVR